MNDVQVQTIWWVGFWRAGEHMYWWTTAISPNDGRAQVRAAVRARVAESTWRQTVDPSVAAPGPAPADAAFAAAGAIAWADLEPHLVDLAAAVPVQTDPALRQETDALARRQRRVREIAAMTLTSPTEEESATLLAEPIALGFRSASMNRAAVTSSLARAWSGPLVDHDGTHACAGSWGRCCYPPSCASTSLQYRALEPAGYDGRRRTRTGTRPRPVGAAHRRRR